ncbi:unnamed protein product [Meloidogyne enterolobii]|uniref:Uncharacterized protein n=1 Tax=Meloidogyne enterolobii TaxID=390850 RepID=A0ACB1AFG2_MELEN
MAQLLPSPITTVPASRLVFNAPFDVERPYKLVIRNVGRRKVAWALGLSNKIENNFRIDDNCGVIDKPQQQATIKIRLNAGMEPKHRKRFGSFG